MFSVGHIYATPGAIRLLNDVGVPFENLLARHVTGDFGDIDEDDQKLNRDDIRLRAGRVMSSYTLPSSLETVWVITELAEDETYTTVLLPDDY